MRCTEEGGVKFGPSMSARQPHSHCHFCGAAYTDLSSYPRTCPACGEMFWSNPIPVAVVAVKMETGVLIIQRGIEPAKGHWALPGGFLETGETWQQGACREVLEETGFQLPIDEIELVYALSAARTRQLILFCTTKSRFRFNDFTFMPSEETLAVRIMSEPERLAFPAHAEFAQRFFVNPQ